jgi:hypothetical protein
MSGLSRQGCALAMCVSFGVRFGGPLHGQEPSTAPKTADQALLQQDQGAT